MCRPLGANMFVFYGGRFAGTGSPLSMNPRTDGLKAPVWLVPPIDSRLWLSAEFARYVPGDALRGPSWSATTIDYMLHLTSTGPVLVATGRL